MGGTTPEDVVLAFGAWGDDHFRAGGTRVFDVLQDVQLSGDEYLWRKVLHGFFYGVERQETQHFSGDRCVGNELKEAIDPDHRKGFRSGDPKE